jgi:hypothetical protein
MEIHIYGHVSFLPPFHEATFCGVPSCVSDKLGCAAGEIRLQNFAQNQSFKIIILTAQFTYLFHFDPKFFFVYSLKYWKIDELEWQKLFNTLYTLCNKNQALEIF